MVETQSTDALRTPFVHDGGPGLEAPRREHHAVSRARHAVHAVRGAARNAGYQSGRRASGATTVGATQPGGNGIAVTGSGEHREALRRCPGAAGGFAGDCGGRDGCPRRRQRGRQVHAGQGRRRCAAGGQRHDPVARTGSGDPLGKGRRRARRRGPLPGPGPRQHARRGGERVSRRRTPAAEARLVLDPRHAPDGRRNRCHAGSAAHRHSGSEAAPSRTSPVASARRSPSGGPSTADAASSSFSTSPPRRLAWRRCARSWRSSRACARTVRP